MRYICDVYSMDEIEQLIPVLFSRSCVIMEPGYSGRNIHGPAL